ncbi:MAG: J domain-containing protein [Oscillospiraceae bacterium]|nr:J domain-containing protein [Oscillospiraceae bacterium]
MSVWEILGIKPCADIKAIRAAYAQKARATHPEDDPEGFIALRGAYKEALRLASLASKEDAPHPPDFDFSGSATQVQAVPARRVGERTAFDFSGLEEAAAHRQAEAMAASDRFIREMTALYKGTEYRNPKAWEVLLGSPELNTLVQSEHFAHAFLACYQDALWHGLADKSFSTPCLKLVMPLCARIFERWGSEMGNRDEFDHLRALEVTSGCREASARTPP